ncbi:MAG: diguanylate cyclase [Planctomycetaceae bacterium]
MTDSLGHVLLVDDDLAIVRLLRKWLEGAGYRVSEASNGSDALNLIEKECPQYLISDWEMPYMDGLELCRLVRQRESTNYVFTILLTGRAFPNDIIAGLDAGADEFIKKPVDRAEILARLRSGSRVIALEKRLHQIANIDSLTTLPNRKSFMGHLDREWARAVDYKIPLSMVMLDIDFFKRINDVHGHQVGDEVLRQVACTLRRETRDLDFLGRYGGEEFCLFLPETSESGAHIVAERIRQSLETAEVLTPNGTRLPITASFGVAQRMQDTPSSLQLIHMADQALLVAKRSGRNRTVSFQAMAQPALPPQVQQRTPTDLLMGIEARTVMTSIVASLRQEESLATASRFFLRFRMSSAPVVDEAGKLVGMLSEKDIMATMLSPEWWKQPIRSAMTPNVVCFDVQTPAAVVYDFLCNVTLRSVVIVSDGCPVGLVNRSSLIRFFTNAQAVYRGLDELVDESEDAIESRQAEGDSHHLRFQRTIEAMTEEAGLLRGQLSEKPAELVPFIVGGASRMQELANELLAISHCVHRDVIQPSDTAPEAGHPQAPAGEGEPVRFPQLSPLDAGQSATSYLG